MIFVTFAGERFSYYEMVINNIEGIVMRAKKIIKIIVKRIFHKGGYLISSIDGEPFFESLIEKFLRNNNELFFIQLGANDGRRFDPVYEFVKNNSKIMRGILLEPDASFG